MARPKAPGVAEIDDNFAYHPATEETGPLHDQVRDVCKKAALALNKILPPGRHRAMAITHLQEAMWAANTSVAVDYGKPTGILAAVFGTESKPKGTVTHLPGGPADVAAKKAAPVKRAPAKKTAVVRAAARVKARDAEILDRLADEEPKAAPTKRVARRATRP